MPFEKEASRRLTALLEVEAASTEGAGGASKGVEDAPRPVCDKYAMSAAACGHLGMPRRVCCFR